MSYKVQMRVKLLFFAFVIAGCVTDGPQKSEPLRVPSAGGLPFKVESIDVVQTSAPAKSELHKWYQENLGLVLKYPGEGWQQFELPSGSPFAVNYTQEIPELHKQRFVVSFKVSDIQAAVQYLLSKGVKFLNPKKPIQEKEWGYLATFYDPQGSLLQVLQDKPAVKQ